MNMPLVKKYQPSFCIVEKSKKLTFINLLQYIQVNWNNPEYGTLIRRSSSSESEVLLNFVFYYVNKNYNAIKITKYGYVYFSQASTVTSGNSIVGLNFQADTESYGGIFYQNLYSPSNAFNRTKSTINRVNSGFVPTNMFRITYFNVPKA